MIVFEDESFLTVYKGMYKGDAAEMADEDFEKLTSEMTSYGKKRAMNLLVKKSYSRRALEKKLEDDGYNSAIIGKVIEFLDSFHYLNDEALAESLVRNNRMTKSRAEIRFLLKRREIPDEVAENAIEEVYSEDDENDDGTDPEMKTIVLLLKKLNMTPEKIAALEYKDRQKLAAKFYRKGFRSDNISKALKLESFE
ncbi:MAG: RecX family transcriptional regulator [Lachnospiraceae bacterium]|nr:RecX family transcriptional regulator [Lachnospiraceae bacterium]